MAGGWRAEGRLSVRKVPSLCGDSTETAWDFLSPSLSVPPLLMRARSLSLSPSLSLSQNKYINLKKNLKRNKCLPRLEAGLSPDVQSRAKGRENGGGQGGGSGLHSPIEPKVVLPVSDKGRAGGQEVSMQLLPGPEHPLRGGLGRGQHSGFKR